MQPPRAESAESTADSARGISCAWAGQWSSNVSIPRTYDGAHLLARRGDQPALFCGDTLFNAGAGNCHNGGHPQQLFQTFVTQLARLPDETRVFPGHEYLARNLEFTLDREPDNDAARSLLDAARQQTPGAIPITTLAEEKRINTFFRLQNPTVVARLREAYPDIGEHPMRARYS